MKIQNQKITGTFYSPVKKTGEKDNLKDSFISGNTFDRGDNDIKSLLSSGPFKNSSLSETEHIRSAEIEETIRERSQNPEIKKAIMGALLYLDDTQIRQREGKGSPQYDSSSGDGCRGEIKLSFGKKQLHIPVPGLKIQNEEGEWANYIHLGPMFLGSKKRGKLPPGIQDSNLFVTAFTSYPFHLFDEDALPESQKIVKDMKELAMKNINSYKRGDGYNFWKLRDGKTSDMEVVAPPNLPSTLIEKCTPLILSQKKFVMKEAIQNIVSKDKNPYGGDAFFNIPNDADDTAVAVAAQKLHSTGYKPVSKDSYDSNPENFKVDTDALLKLEEFRDLERKKSLPFDSWKGENTGSYLTWIKDENSDTFMTPETGVIPGGVNLVDEVVNANTVFSMALNGFKDGEGYKDALNLIEKTVFEKHWQKGSIYYPQRMIFPYTASRAFRDGGADEPVMKDAMKKLLCDVLDDRTEFLKENPKKNGAFPGGFDKTTHLSTALGVIFLLNIGKELAEEAGRGEEYDKAIKEGIDYLIKEGMKHKIKHKDTFNRDGEDVSGKDRGLKWQEGLFFVGDVQNATQWISEAYTTSMVLEAMAKYSMAYDKGGVSIMNGRRIRIENYTRNNGDAPEEFKFEIK